MYSIIVDSKAFNFLEKLEKPLRERIWKKIESTKENPHRFFERLAERQDYKLRVGVYRVIADINDKEQLIQITIIGHRKNIYDNI